MKISIYQVKISQDILNLAFRDLETIKKKGNGKVPSEYYDRVYTGEVEAVSLDEVYVIFNVDHPVSYKGRSLTQSDVVEVLSENEESRFYFCDTYTFVPIEFDKSKCTEGNGR